MHLPEVCTFSRSAPSQARTFPRRVPSPDVHFPQLRPSHTADTACASLAPIFFPRTSLTALRSRTVTSCTIRLRSASAAHPNRCEHLLEATLPPATSDPCAPSEGAVPVHNKLRKNTLGRTHTDLTEEHWQAAIRAVKIRTTDLLFPLCYERLC